jgi:GNAT superfamily N-acetyltransferase
MESIEKCGPPDVPEILSIVNEAADAYRGAIPSDCWSEPYMPLEELRQELADGVEFWGFREGRRFVGVMGLQAVGDVALVRHAYTRTSAQGKGIGTALIAHLLSLTDRPVLVGTWKAATWAIRFYEQRGFRLLPEAETATLLRRYWKISDRQLETSVVLSLAAGDPVGRNGRREERDPQQ